MNARTRAVERECMRFELAARARRAAAMPAAAPAPAQREDPRVAALAERDPELAALIGDELRAAHAEGLDPLLITVQGGGAILADLKRGWSSAYDLTPRPRRRLLRLR